MPECSLVAPKKNVLNYHLGNHMKTFLEGPIRSINPVFWIWAPKYFCSNIEIVLGFFTETEPIMCVCIYICVCVCVYIYIYTHTYICIYIHVYMCIYVNNQLYLFLYITNNIYYIYIFIFIYIYLKELAHVMVWAGRAPNPHRSW